MTAADAEPGRTDPAVAAVLSAASTAASRTLGQAQRLGGGSGRSMVLRCRDESGGTVVVKSYQQTAGGVSGFASEAAGLALAVDTGLAPQLVAVDSSELVVVMSDLGTGASLADVLLADSAAAASDSLLSWAQACGELATVTSDRPAHFAELRNGYARGGPDHGLTAALQRPISAAEHYAALVGVTAPPGLAGELAWLADAIGAGRCLVFSPGDVCADNNILTGRGIRFLDFESAGFHNAFLDAAYIRMPFSTCWCVFRLPASISAAAEGAYRQRICRVWPELGDDEIWQPGLRTATAAWTLHAMSWLLRKALDGDRLINPGVTSPGLRQLMRYRWQYLLSELETGGDLPSVAALMGALLAATEHWQVADLPQYPPWR